jgi:hypothetical protein
VTRWLVVKGVAGLGNRLCALATALGYARATGRTLVIDWNDWVYSPDRRDVFARLFAAPRTPPVAAIPADLPVAPAIWSGQLERSVDWMIDRHGIGYGDETRDRLSIDPGTDPDAPVAVFLDWSTRHDALGTPARLRDELRPAARIAARVDDLARRHLGAPTVGAHVRQTDNMSADFIGTHGVSVGAVEAAVAARLTPSATLFLATDNRAVLEHFRRRFPRVVSLPKWYPAVAGEPMHVGAPDRLAGGEDALVDLLLLGRCDALVYSSSTSFALAALAMSDLAPDRLVDVAGARPDPAEAGRWIARRPPWLELPREALSHARRRARRLRHRLTSLYHWLHRVAGRPGFR